MILEKRERKRSRTETSPEVNESDEVDDESPSAEESVVGSAATETLLPDHFPSQTLNLPSQVYGGRFIKRTNDRFMMKR